MSVVVAIKDEDKVWMACDSQITAGHTKETLSNPNNYKIIKLTKEPSTLIGVVGEAIATNAIKIQDEMIDELTKLKGDFNFKYVVEKIVPKLMSLGIQYRFSYKNKDSDYYFMSSSFVFAHKDKLFTIDGYGYVIEIDNYCANGSGFRPALGYLEQCSDENKKDAIIKAVKASIAIDNYVDYPIIVMNTKDDEVIIIEK